MPCQGQAAGLLRASLHFPTASMGYPCQDVCLRRRTLSRSWKLFTWQNILLFGWVCLPIQLHLWNLHPHSTQSHYPTDTCSVKLVWHGILHVAIVRICVPIIWPIIIRVRGKRNFSDQVPAKTGRCHTPDDGTTDFGSSATCMAKSSFPLLDDSVVSTSGLVEVSTSAASAVVHM